MFLRILSVSAAFGFGMLAFDHIPALAQSNKPNTKKGGPTLSSVEVNGKLVDWQPGAIRMTTEKGLPMVIALPQKANSVSYKGKLKDGALAKGMLVRIEAPAVNGQFLEPVKSLEVVFTDTSHLNPKSSMIERSMYMPGVYPLSQLVGPGQPPSSNPNIRLVGLVTGLGEGKLALQCGNRKVVIDLAKSLTMTVQASHLQFAKSGDSVKTSGSINPATNQYIASSVTITGSQPIGNSVPTPASEQMQLRVKERGKSEATPETSSGTKKVPKTSDGAEKAEGGTKLSSADDIPVGELPKLSGVPES